MAIGIDPPNISPACKLEQGLDGPASFSSRWDVKISDQQTLAYHQIKVGGFNPSEKY